MVYSMTGFGRATVELEHYSVTVEMKSVNHRFSDVSIKGPKYIYALEKKIKKLISTYVKRGRIEVFITIEGDELVERSLQVDWHLLDQYYETIKTAIDKYKLPEQITIKQLFSLHDVVMIKEKDGGNEQIENTVLEAIEDAVVQLKRTRYSEGQQLLIDISTQLEKMQNSVNVVSKRSEIVYDLYREKITKRISEFLSGTVDEQRLLTEVAIFADKADINEELTRINSHISHFFDTMQRKQEIGRKLDFFVQELNREINTIGSKANDVLIAQHVVEMKSFLEKIKEQVQNIE
ncbi:MULTISPECIES: YicC/YloC family endoribonuclease [Bacillaceae]|uniref:YicC/YloC family endoribonuclease n=1 Tax=Bacillaceae TaxID=186817 RepID=UPI002A13FB87|nr:YicC/YloC family endoribonuclease [Cytobacillus sp. IB215316]MDX8362310.1 YicC/YloC family endoribonuclease [Cytobacillus sp. IB215316]